MLEIGLVGLPNVGKSSLFNALTAAGAEVSNYPFTTIDEQVGVVPVPDPRLDRLAAVLAPEETTPAFVRFVDIAGLVEGASRGEGLGNQFLGHIRQVDAIAHVVRCFEDPQVVHVAGSVDPVRDARVIDTELLLADLELVSQAVAKRRKQWQTDPRTFAAEKERLEAWLAVLEEGRPVRDLDPGPEDLRRARALGILTARPTLFVANVDEDHPAPEERAAELAATLGGLVVPIPIRLEAELRELDPEERDEMVRGLGLGPPGLDRLVDAAFELLGLLRFYTVVSGKLRAWSVPRGTKAPQAAGVIHTDMEQGFVRARVVDWGDLETAGSFQALHEAGRLRTEGKDYAIRDGDVVEFLFKA